MTSFSTVNPATGQLLREYSYATSAQIEQTLSELQASHEFWSRQSLPQRQAYLVSLAHELRTSKEILAQEMTKEMGKTIAESRAEVEKCAAAAEYYASNAETMLAPEIISDGSLKARIEKESLGVVLAIMPWNFPCWQVIRFAVPALLVGNTILLKHADITVGTAALLADVFTRAASSQGYTEKIFIELRLSHEQISNVIADKRVAAVTFTGSVRGGALVAAQAGQALKKSVMELGGSDAYIILEDADITAAIRICAQGRLQNAGQSCVAAKRFFVPQKISQEFQQEFIKIFSDWKWGNPQLETTQMGPLAHKKFQAQIHSQVQKSGGRVLCGGILPQGQGQQKGNGDGAFYPPTVLEMPPTKSTWTEEFFGPVACVWTYENPAEAIAQANNSIFGLGGAVFSQDLKKATQTARELRCGFVAINDMVKSDVRVPFGGQKSSGFGRELSHFGLMEFVNVKTITGV